MKKNKAIIMLLIINFIVYFSIDNVKYDEGMLFYIRCLVFILFIPLIYFSINNIYEILKSKFSEVIFIIKSEREKVDTKLEEVIKENRDLKLENIKLSNVFFENHNKIQIEIESLNNKLTNNIDMLTVAIEESNKEIKSLVSTEGDFIEKLEEKLSDLNRNYNGISNLFIESFNRSEEKNSKSIDAIKNVLTKNNEDLAEIISKSNKDTNGSIDLIGGEFLETVDNFKEKVSEIIKLNNQELNRSIDKYIRGIKSSNETYRQNIMESGIEEHRNTLELLTEMRTIFNKMSKLQENLLLEIDSNQRKLLELNKEDVEFMRELIK